VDVDPDTGNINADLIEERITDRTKCILPVHLYGNVCDMVKICAIAARHNLTVVEDCAHALESKLDGVRVGELSDAACFSFYATKSITCGDGGAVYSKRDGVIKKVKLLRTHGMNKDAYQRQSGLPFWDLVDFGFKCNMTDIQAAVLSSQIDRIDELHGKREKNYRLYESILSANKNWDGYLIRWPSFHQISGYHLFTIRVDPKLRDDLVVHLKNSDIGVGVHYRSINRLTKMRQVLGDSVWYHVSEKIGESTISLPLYPSLKEDEIQYVCEKVFEFFRNH
jgi:dTDP-4-amino-4,6-dideoxygalactose transaminase